LSHCWGGMQPIRLTVWNRAEFLERIHFDSLPLTFRNAIAVTRRLCIRYLWIDSLCIIQDSRDDWDHEAALMDEVYGSSYINIAAANASNSAEGLFRHRRTALLPPSVVRLRWRGEEFRCNVLREDMMQGDLLSEPLHRRAWVFQERMLSPRTVHFGGRQVTWQCPELTACESMPNGLPAGVNDMSPEERVWRSVLPDIKSEAILTDVQTAELRRMWQVAVSAFTNCNLTVQADKLPAIAGVAKLIGKALGEEYVAGLWKYGLAEQLAWRVRNCRTSEGKPSRRQGQSLSDYRAPSWAWAS
ncbi:hypothetical protein BAUCODRAFT_52925, partial [Baudoinia panamericana UAMH 10762]